MVICLKRGADLHMAQLIPLPLTVSCSSKIQIGFIFLVPAQTKGPLNGCVCVYVRVCVHACVFVTLSYDYLFCCVDADATEWEHICNSKLSN